MNGTKVANFRCFPSPDICSVVQPGGSPGFNHHNHLLKLQEQCWVLLLSDDLQPNLRQFIPPLPAMKPDICCSDI